MPCSVFVCVSEWEEKRKTRTGEKGKKDHRLLSLLIEISQQEVNRRSLKTPQL